MSSLFSAKTVDFLYNCRELWLLKLKLRGKPVPKYCFTLRRADTMSARLGNRRRRRAESVTSTERSGRGDIGVSGSVTVAISPNAELNFGREKFHHHIPSAHRFHQQISQAMNKKSLLSFLSSQSFTALNELHGENSLFVAM